MLLAVLPMTISRRENSAASAVKSSAMLSVAMLPWRASGPLPTARALPRKATWLAVGRVDDDVAAGSSELARGGAANAACRARHQSDLPGEGCEFHLF